LATADGNRTNQPGIRREGERRRARASGGWSVGGAEQTRGKTRVGASRGRGRGRRSRQARHHSRAPPASSSARYCTVSLPLVVAPRRAALAGELGPTHATAATSLVVAAAGLARRQQPPGVARGGCQSHGSWGPQRSHTGRCDFGVGRDSHARNPPPTPLPGARPHLFLARLV